MAPTVSHSPNAGFAARDCTNKPATTAIIDSSVVVDAADKKVQSASIASKVGRQLLESTSSEAKTLASVVMLLRRYTDRHDFIARVFTPPPQQGASVQQTLPPARAVRVAFDDDATVPQVMAACESALSSSEADAADADADDVRPDFLLLMVQQRDGDDDASVRVLDDQLAAALRADGKDASAKDADAFAFTVTTTTTSDGGKQTAYNVHSAAGADAADDGPFADLERTRGHLNTALAALPAAACDNIRAHAIPLITASELEQQHGWNATCARPALLARALTLPSVVLASARATPHAEAVSLESGEAWTYRQLVTRARRIAKRLTALVKDTGAASALDDDVDVGDLKGHIVGVYLGRGPELLASLLAVQMTRAAYLPLDPVYPAERVGCMLLDAGVSAVITSNAEGLVTRVDEAARSATPIFKKGDAPPPADADNGAPHPLANLPKLLVDDAAAAAAAVDDENAEEEEDEVEEAREARDMTRGHPDDLAYVIFTSGSTGRPKGVQVTQRSLVNFLGSMAELTGATLSTRLCAVTTVCFDIAGLELFLPAWVGGRLVVASEDTAKDPRALDALMREQDINMMQATPTTWRMLLGTDAFDADADADAHRRGLTALVGGEALPTELAGDMLRSIGKTFNVYGPTETTVWSTAARVSLPHLTSIGRPIANTRVYVMAASEPLEQQQQDAKVFMSPSPVGVPGEICIAGAGVSLGYLGREDLTEERFPPDPYFAKGDGDGAAVERMYRTGDLGRYRADGTLQCLGRLDHQVKIRGYRVELGEIETALAALPEVEQAVVMARPMAAAGGGDATQQQMQLVAYVIESEDAGDDKNGAAGNDDDGKKDLAKDLAEAEAWGAVYDEAYAVRDALDETDPSLNFSGYGNSYTPGKVHEVPVVREWVETICDRIAKLKPRRALELGCGNGMILLRLAKACERYVGTDLSTNAIEFVREVITKHPNFLLPNCGLDTAGAHEAMRFVDERLDTVVCNGVSMYFPSADYLCSVVSESLGALAPEEPGHFFLGDVRNARLLRHFHASVQCYTAAPEVTFAALRVAAAAAVKQEKEFLVNPAAFLSMARARLAPQGLCDRVTVDMRRGWHRTEFGMYRYDVVFRRPSSAALAASTPETAAKGGGGGATYDVKEWDASRDTLAAVEATLTGGSGVDYLAFTGLPDARLVYEAILLAELREPSRDHGTVGALREYVAAAAESAGKTAVEPEAVYQLGEKLGYSVNAMWSPTEPTRFDVVFAREGAPEPEPIVFASLRHHGMTVQEPTSPEDEEALMEMLREMTNKGAAATAEAEATLAEASKSAAGDASVTAAVSGAPAAAAAAAEEEEESAWSIMGAAKARALRSALRSRLPPYMIPAAVVSSLPGGGGFPMTANGKVDRAALPAPASLRRLGGGGDDGDERSTAYVAPEGETEEAVAVLFEEILSPEGGLQVGALDDFFELGGHSLLAMQFIGRLEAAAGVRVQMRHLADAPTPRDLALVVLDMQKAATAAGGDKTTTAAAATTSGNDVGEMSGRHSPKSPLEPSAPSPAPSPAPSLTVVDPAALPHGPVTRVDEIFFETRDGCRLSARLWLPAGVDVDADTAAAWRVPAVVEVLPYGVHHATVDADEATWPYLAGHGIACIRVDSRGAGNSSGVLDDEYSAQQQRDACDAVEWAASRAWCNGNVGLMGCSWGGFIALQAAALAGAGAAREAPSLKAVCAVCATDDRAGDDMHWMGGALLGENLAWGAWLLDSLAQPPVDVAAEVEAEAEAAADVEGKAARWEARWVDRLTGLKPLHSEWASHHPTSEYWAEGSVGRGLRGKDDVDGDASSHRIAVPVLSVGGFNGGGYANSTPRLTRCLGADQVTAVMGGWVHNYPHLSQAGPSFGFLAEALAFWRKHLYDSGDEHAPATAAAAAATSAPTPGVRIHVQRPPLRGAPVTSPERADGYWISEESQRALDQATEKEAMSFNLTSDGVLTAPAAATPVVDVFGEGASVQLTDTPSNPVGVASGRWFTFGDGDDLPGDQRPDDDKSACFDAVPVAAETPIVGAPRVTLALALADGTAAADAAAATKGVVVARVCAVSPSGVSHRVTYGVADIKQQARQTPSTGSPLVVDVACNFCAFSLPAGWRLRVAVSQTYWPVVTPNPRGFTRLAVVGGAATVPALPAVTAASAAAAAAAAPSLAPPLEVVAGARNQVLRRGKGVRNERTPRAASRTVDLGTRRLGGDALVVEGSSADRSEIVHGLMDGGGSVSHEQHIERRSVVRGVCAAETEVRADMIVRDGEYHFTTSLDAYVLGDGGGDDASARRSVFSQRWTKIVPAPHL